MPLLTTNLLITMNTNRFVIKALIAIIVLSSCESELEVAPISNLSQDNFYKTASDIEQAVIASYDPLQDVGQYGLNYYFYGDFRADDGIAAATASGGAYGELELFQESSNNFLFEETWNSCFKGVQRCNLVLSRIGDVDMPVEVKDVRIGEVKFLRALTYFNLVRLFGAVPLVTTETRDPFDLFSVGRTPVDQVYTQIITDLEEAGSLLPSTTSETGRATQGASDALLGKVFLTLGRWQEALEALNRVNGYSLNPVFANNFGISNENGPESIFEVQFQAGNGEGSRYPNEFAADSTELIGGVGTLGRSIGVHSIELYNSFDPNDSRRDASLAITEQGNIIPLKLIDIPVADYDSDVNIIVLRYADVLLMKAEALNELGYSPSGEAFDLLNQVRNRAGLSSLTSTQVPNQQSFRQAVYDERRFEFVSEFSRWFDLLRTDLAIETMNQYSANFNIQEFQLLFPVPLTAIDTMNDPVLFPQNPGY